SKELEAEPTPEAREVLFKKKVAESYARGKAINMAAYLEIDDVIDPADTRRWILRGLKSLPQRGRGGGRKFVDTWGSARDRTQQAGPSDSKDARNIAEGFEFGRQALHRLDRTQQEIAVRNENLG